jgi:hypothetical protein
MRKVMFALALGLLSSSALPASAQSTSPAAGFFGGGGGYYPVPPAVRAKMLRDLERGKAIHECRAYGFCGQQRRR